MFRTVAAAIALFASATVSAQALSPGEAMRHDMPPGFKIGFDKVQGPMHIVELVPEGESVEAWTKMATLQTFAGGVQRTPEQLLAFIGDGFARACPGVLRDPIRAETINGYANAFMALRCPSNPATGKREDVIFRAIRGESNFYVAQMAVRYAAPPAEAEADRRWLRAVFVCDPASKAHPCTR